MRARRPRMSSHRGQHRRERTRRTEPVYHVDRAREAEPYGARFLSGLSPAPGGPGIAGRTPCGRGQSPFVSASAAPPISSRSRICWLRRWEMAGASPRVSELLARRRSSRGVEVMPLRYPETTPSRSTFVPSPRMISYSNRRSHKFGRIIREDRRSVIATVDGTEPHPWQQIRMEPGSSGVARERAWSSASDRGVKQVPSLFKSSSAKSLALILA